MKCPKCLYIGFETGDRCKNCGYDFSLLTIAESQPPDYEIHPAAIDDVPVHVVEHLNDIDDPWLGTEEQPDDPRIELATRLPEADVSAEPLPDLPLTPPAPLVDAPPAPSRRSNCPREVCRSVAGRSEFAWRGGWDGFRRTVKRRETSVDPCPGCKRK